MTVLQRSGNRVTVLLSSGNLAGTQAVIGILNRRFHDRTGVCRDYAHLAVALCRCMNIPARYCTGYLGEVGVARPHGPPDFAAWFEAYLGGRGHTFDPDVAIGKSFGANTLASFRVWTDEGDWEQSAATTSRIVLA
jgi:hypothetical protein